METKPFPQILLRIGGCSGATWMNWFYTTAIFICFLSLSGPGAENIGINRSQNLIFVILDSWCGNGGDAFRTWRHWQEMLLIPWKVAPTTMSILFCNSSIMCTIAFLNYGIFPSPVRILAPRTGQLLMCARSQSPKRRYDKICGCVLHTSDYWLHTHSSVGSLKSWKR